jgi:4-hydroxy-tetrahydrodipicolinate synthase
MRPDFAMLTGVEYLLPSVPLGGVGSYSAAGSICPNLCSQLFDACIAGDWPRARELQSKFSWLGCLFRDNTLLAQRRHGDDGPPGRPTRAPLPTATTERQAISAASLNALGILESEPHGW